ncbi:helix-hairpin-helix domain-containing protein [Oenococcus oeni]|uniref:helix-hairpin-helix domain-containing protein n=1 Tax=Oenococcus oeni TaxID=1247 RepID=UPI00156E14FF|nr:helix-hairpin-helix domain-containing protein [Oenococcus oeni]
MNLKIIFIFGGISFLAISFFIMSSIKRTDKEENILFSSATSLKNDSNLSVSSSKNLSSKDEKVDFYVDVKGAVAQEKVVKVKSGEIIISAINKSGGAKSNADLSQINLAAEIISGQVIYVPKKGEKIPEQFCNSVSNSSSTNTNASQAQIDINTADLSALQTINGIGEKKAEEIVKYREEHGKFKSIDDLKNISGFGDKTVEKLNDYVFIK